MTPGRGHVWEGLVIKSVPENEAGVRQVAMDCPLGSQHLHVELGLHHNLAVTLPACHLSIVISQ